jgi:nicotinic acid mononucleotide adenylyltransferase
MVGRRVDFLSSFKRWGRWRHLLQLGRLVWMRGEEKGRMSYRGGLIVCQLKEGRRYLLNRLC